MAAKIVRVPAAIGGGLAAGGSYVMYKVEEATSYTNDQLDKAKDLISDGKDWFNGLWNSKKVDNIDEVKENKRIEKEEEEDSEEEDKEPENNKTGIVAGAAIMGLQNDDDESNGRDNSDEQILNLTKQMIEIRNLLSQIDQNDTLKLPSIVVIGSQSSGKSSVLEAIVGKQFLPKGDNMVTRRPIELTLINDPGSLLETAEFTDLKLGTLTDFTNVSRILMELNLAVPSSTAISSEPIRLTIKSAKTPDLTLIDLPGYIQIQSDDQPTELKQKIRDVCMKYLEPPNIILAISPADVDLANSSALRAAKMVDPKGERTLGVITKMDLVDGIKGKELLKNNKYPLKMGYVGVISRVPEKSIFLSNKKSNNLSQDLTKNEENYFFSQENEKYFFNATVGIKLLKKKLMKILEKSMSNSLLPTHEAIQKELDDASYKFKVEFNDRLLTPETYIDNNLDSLKVAIKELGKKFGKNEILSLLRSELDQKVLDLLALRYWNNTEVDIKELENLSDDEDDLYWHNKLDLTTSSLTKIGVGRLSTNLITNCLLDEIQEIIKNTNFQKHPIAQEIIMKCAIKILNSKFYSTADQVENCIKPYKYEIDLEDSDWKLSKQHTIKLLNEELKQSNEYFEILQSEIGKRKLQNVISFIEKNQLNEENLQFSKKLIKKGKEAVFTKDRIDLLKLRLMAIKSKSCQTKENKYKCPEIFLNSVVDKLTKTSILFLNIELLSDFYYNFPRELDLNFKKLNDEDLIKIINEDEKIKNHINLQKRKESLEEALKKIENIIALKNSGIVRFD